MDALLLPLSLVIWIVFWVLVVKKRGSIGKLWANVIGAVGGFVLATVIIAVLVPEPPGAKEAREAAAAERAEADKEKARLAAEAEKEKALKAAEAEKKKDRSTMAAIICANFVERSLKAPKSADFPFGRAAYGTAKLDDQKYLVRSYVDAQNSFGAMLRNDYTCGIQYVGGSDSDDRSWKLIGLDFDK